MVPISKKGNKPLDNPKKEGKIRDPSYFFKEVFLMGPEKSWFLNLGRAELVATTLITLSLIFSVDVSQAFFLWQDRDKSSPIHPDSILNTFTSFITPSTYFRKSPFSALLLTCIFLILIQGAVIIASINFKKFERESKNQNLLNPKFLKNILAFYLTYYDVFMLVIVVFFRDSFLCTMRTKEILKISAGVFNLDNLALGGGVEPAALTEKVEQFTMLMSHEEICYSKAYYLVVFISTFALLLSFWIKIIQEKMLSLLPSPFLISTRSHKDYFKVFYYFSLIMMQTIFFIFRGKIGDNEILVRIAMFLIIAFNLTLITITTYLKTYYNQQKQVYAVLGYIFNLMFMILWFLGYENVAKKNTSLNRIEIFVFFGISFTVVVRIIQNFSQTGITSDISAIADDDKKYSQNGLIRFIYAIQVYINRSFEDSKFDEKNEESTLVVQSLIKGHQKNCLNILCFCKLNNEPTGSKQAHKMQMLSKLGYFLAKKNMKNMTSKNTYQLSSLNLSINFHALMYLGRPQTLRKLFKDQEHGIIKSNLESKFLGNCIQHFCKENLKRRISSLYFYSSKMDLNQNVRQDGFGNSLLLTHGIKKLKTKILENMRLRLSCIEMFKSMPSSQKNYSPFSKFWATNNRIILNGKKLQKLTSGKYPNIYMVMYFYYIHCRQDIKNALKMLKKYKELKSKEITINKLFFDKKYWNSSLIFLNSKYSDKSTQMISYVSSNVKSKLKWTPNQLENLPLSTILPSPIKEMHKIFVKNGQGKLLRKHGYQKFFVEDRLGNLLKVDLKLSINYSLDSGFQYMSILQVDDQRDKNSYHFLVDENNEISGLDKKMKKMNLRKGVKLEEVNCDLDQAISDTRLVLQEQRENQTDIKYIVVTQANEHAETIRRWTSYKEWKIGKIINFQKNNEASKLVSFLKIQSYAIDHLDKSIIWVSVILNPHITDIQDDMSKKDFKVFSQQISRVESDIEMSSSTLASNIQMTRVLSGKIDKKSENTLVNQIGLKENKTENGSPKFMIKKTAIAISQLLTINEDDSSFPKCSDDQSDKGSEYSKNVKEINNEEMVLNELKGLQKSVKKSIGYSSKTKGIKTQIAYFFNSDFSPNKIQTVVILLVIFGILVTIIELFDNYTNTLSRKYISKQILEQTQLVAVTPETILPIMLTSIWLDNCRLAREFFLPFTYFLPYSKSPSITYCFYLPYIRDQRRPYREYADKLGKLDIGFLEKINFDSKITKKITYFMPEFSKLLEGTSKEIEWRKMQMSLVQQIDNHQVTYDAFISKNFTKFAPPDYISLKKDGGKRLDRNADYLEEQVRRNLNGPMSKAFKDLGDNSIDLLLKTTKLAELSGYFFLANGIIPLALLGIFTLVMFCWTARRLQAFYKHLENLNVKIFNLNFRKMIWILRWNYSRNPSRKQK